MLPWSAELAGRFDQSAFDSTLLRGNPLGDPHERPVLVYLPPGYDESDRRYPSIYVAKGYTGHLGMWFNRTPFRQPYPELLDACSPPVRCRRRSWCSSTRGPGRRLASTWTPPGTGQYHSYLCDEIVPWVDAQYRTHRGPGSPGITGKSSGGYAAMVTPLLRPDVFGALATHAGDAAFEVCYQPEFPSGPGNCGTCTTARTRSSSPILEPRRPADEPGSASCWRCTGTPRRTRPSADGTVLFPMTNWAELIPEVWERWLAWDPVAMVEQPSTRRRCGRCGPCGSTRASRTSITSISGATAFHRAVREAGVPEGGAVRVVRGQARRDRVPLSAGGRMAVPTSWPANWDAWRGSRSTVAGMGHYRGVAGRGRGAADRQVGRGRRGPSCSRRRRRWTRKARTTTPTTWLEELSDPKLDAEKDTIGLWADGAWSGTAAVRGVRT